MSKKYIAIRDCEYQGKVYRAGEWALFPDDVEIANLFWKSQDEYNQEQEEEIKTRDVLSSMSEEEKDAKIKSLTKKLKAAEKNAEKGSEKSAEKPAEPSKEKVNDK